MKRKAAVVREDRWRQKKQKTMVMKRIPTKETDADVKTKALDATDDKISTLCQLNEAPGTKLECTCQSRNTRASGSSYVFKNAKTPQ